MKTVTEAVSTERLGEEQEYARRHGKVWLEILVRQYGEDLRGLSLAELAKLPDVGWVQQAQSRDSMIHRAKRKLGRVGLKHPSVPNFSFDDCQDFFDGSAYLAALKEKYGDNLEFMPDEVWFQLPKLEYPVSEEDRSQWPIYLNPAERVDALRKAEVFLLQQPVE